MKNSKTPGAMSMKEAIQTASKAARRKSFKKGQPVAISKNGQVFLVYSDNREEPVTISSENNGK